MPLTDLLQWIHQTRKTGALIVESLDYTTTLFLKEGRIISSSSTEPRSHLGQFLLAHTRVTEEDLRRAFERQEETRVYLGKNIFVKTLLGKILLEEGLLSEEEITRVLRVKAEETVYNLFLSGEGSFRLEVNELPPEELVPISLDIMEVLHRGIERVEQWKRIRTRIPSNYAFFRVDRERIPARLKLDEFGGKVLALLGEERSVKDVMLALHATEFEVNSRIHSFLEAGFVTVEGEEPATMPPLREGADAAAPPDQLVEKGRQLFDQRAYADTVIAARQALRAAPGHPEARRLLERSERELADSFYARLSASGDVPFLRRPIEQARLGKLSAEERFLLERVNGTWSIGSIVKLSPLREADALAIFEKFLTEGLVGVKREG